MLNPVSMVPWYIKIFNRVTFSSERKKQDVKRRKKTKYCQKSIATSTQKLVKIHKRWFQPANSVRSMYLLIKIHSTKLQAKEIKKLKNFHLYTWPARFLKSRLMATGVKHTCTLHYVLYVIEKDPPSLFLITPLLIFCICIG